MQLSYRRSTGDGGRRVGFGRDSGPRLVSKANRAMFHRLPPHLSPAHPRSITNGKIASNLRVISAFDPTGPRRLRACASQPTTDWQHGWSKRRDVKEHEDASADRKLEVDEHRKSGIADGAIESRPNQQLRIESGSYFEHERPRSGMQLPPEPRMKCRTERPRWVPALDCHGKRVQVLVRCIANERILEPCR